MIIEFAITNFRSIKDRQVFSMLPSPRINERKNPLLKAEKYKDLEALPVAAVHGKNNVGKTNLIKAFHAFKWLVLNSHRFTIGQTLKPNESFRFDKQTQNAPTTFEIDFIAPDKRRYEVIVSFDKERILKEEVRVHVVSDKGSTNIRKWYVREFGAKIKFGSDLEGEKKSIENRLIDNMLFLSKAVHENNAALKPIFSFFSEQIQIVNLDEMYMTFQLKYLGKMFSEEQNSLKLSTLNQALSDIDTGILRLETKKAITIPENISIEEAGGDISGTSEQEREEMKAKLLDLFKHDIEAVHPMYDGQEVLGETKAPLSEESEGTQKFIALFPKFLELGQRGGVFIVDELERSFHPLLTLTLLKILNNPATNPKNAQLIFTTHSQEVMDILDRDQINLMEKDKYGSTEIFAVSAIRGLRKDASLQDKYMDGSLEGIPKINEQSIFRSLQKAYEQAEKE